MSELSVRAVLPALLLPPLLFVLLAMLGALLVRWHRCAGALLVGIAAASLLVLATPMAAGWLRTSLERDIAAAPPGIEPAAIIVLSGDAVRGAAGPEVGPLTLERLRAGAALQRRTGLPVLVSGGPLRAGEPQLARLMAHSLETDFGVPVRWIEDASRTTGENAILSAAMLSVAGIRAAYLVTHAWHLPRAQEEFAHAGFPVAPAPVRIDPAPTGRASEFLPRADRLADSWWAIHEWAGRVVRRLGG